MVRVLTPAVRSFWVAAVVRLTALTLKRLRRRVKLELLPLKELGLIKLMRKF
jgi:hypothetical protein